MNQIAQFLTDPPWWFPAVFVAVVINLVSSWIFARFVKWRDGKLGFKQSHEELVDFYVHRLLISAPIDRVYREFRFERNSAWFAIAFCLYQGVLFATSSTLIDVEIAAGTQIPARMIWKETVTQFMVAVVFIISIRTLIRSSRFLRAVGRLSA